MNTTSRKATRLVRRASVLGMVIGLTASLAACSSGSAAPAPDENGSAPVEVVDITVGAPPSIFSLALHTGVTSGLFEEAGFNVEITNIQSMGEGMPLLLDGTYDYIVGDVQNTILAASEGLPLVIGAPNTVTASSPVENGKSFGPLLVLESSGMTDIKDLDGKVVGTNSIGGAAYMDYFQLFEEAGITVEWVEVPGPQQVAALQQGQVQAITTAEPNATNATLSGEIIRLTNADDMMGGAPNFAWIAAQPWVQQNSDIAKRFQAAVIEANKLVMTDRAAAEEALAGYTELKPEVIAAANFPIFAEKPYTAADLQSTADRMVKFDLISESKLPDLSSLIPSF